MTPQEFQKFLMRQLRKISYLWAPRNQALQRAKVSWGKYKCRACQEIYPRKEIAIDHIKPVVDPAQGFITWDDHIARLFCDINGFQILCKECHKEKTNRENAIRRTR